MDKAPNTNPKRDDSDTTVGVKSHLSLTSPQPRARRFSFAPGFSSASTDPGLAQALWMRGGLGGRRLSMASPSALSSVQAQTSPEVQSDSSKMRKCQPEACKDVQLPQEPRSQ